MPPPPENRSDAPYRFLAYEVSYFSAKVRPALRYKGLWVDEQRADLREILKRTGYAFIPVVITPAGETWQDSTDIVRRLEERHPEPPLFPPGGLQRTAAHLAELYNDEFGLIPAMHYRWGSELGESSSRARFSAMTGSVELGNRAADRMVQARFLVGASVEAASAIEDHTRELLAALGRHFEAHPYLLGARQSFGDCALMGLFDGHLFTDLVSRRLLLETAVPVVSWIERCRYPNADLQGEWLARDEIAPTAVEALGVMGRDAAPLIIEVLRGIEEWADSRPAEPTEPPRAVGTLRTSLRGCPVERALMPYTLYSVQQVQDFYRPLDAAQRARIDAALAGTGWPDVLAYEPRHRLRRDGFQLVFE